jgi:hypothetical protein
VTGAATINGSPDSVVAQASVGASEVQGSLNVTEAADSAASSVAVAVKSSAIIIEFPTSLSAQGSVVAGANSAIFESADGFVSASNILVIGTGLPIELGDQLTADTGLPQLFPVKYWNGSEWVAQQAKVWDGTEWAPKPVRHYTSSGWGN